MFLELMYFSCKIFFKYIDYGIIELIDTKKMEGYLFEFKNIKNLNIDREIKCLGGRWVCKKVCVLFVKNK